MKSKIILGIATALAGLLAGCGKPAPVTRWKYDYLRGMMREQVRFETFVWGTNEPPGGSLSNSYWLAIATNRMEWGFRGDDWKQVIRFTPESSHLAERAND